MIPVLLPAQVGEVDRAAPEPVEVLIERAGFAVARAARRLLGGAYGRRIVVLAGPGNNGNDGRMAARFLSSWGARCVVCGPDGVGSGLGSGSGSGLGSGLGLDLVIDAAFGTGLTRPYQPPAVGDVPVLAVDIPSGINGTTGLAGSGSGSGSALTAAATVTFAAYKPGLLLGAGASAAGSVSLAPIGLAGLAREVADIWLVSDDDVALLPARARDAHKWQSAVLVVAGSPHMQGAPLMCSHAVMRAGAGYALVGIPGASGLPAGEHVGVSLPAQGWAAAAASAAERVKAIVVGPGLGPAHADDVTALLTSTSAPAVVDADGLNSLASLGSLDAVQAVTAKRSGPLVLTPHAGEYERLTGHAPEADRIADVQATARQTGAVVLLKGSTTVIAAPDGRVRIAAAGRPNLATAGTGDVLSGVTAAFLAGGVDALDAAALAAHVHGRAAQAGRPVGLIASDLPELVSSVLSELVGSPEAKP